MTIHSTPKRTLPFFFTIFCLLLAACSPAGGIGGGSTTPTKVVPTPAPTLPPGSTTDICPADLGQMPSCHTPHSIRVAYGVESLYEHGFTGKGQTVIDIVSFGSPTLQQDMDTFDQQFGLPPIKIQIISNIVNEPEQDPNGDKPGWAEETTLDVEVIHALAPGANIVVLTSPVAETEGTFGLPEFRQLLQYAIDHHLGNIISNSWGASEATLKDSAGQQETQKWEALLQQATTQDGITIFASSGDGGATDYLDAQQKHLSPVPTIGFLADSPWVTAVGGTSLQQNEEIAWNQSEGGFSSFYATPTYQQTIAASMKSLFQNRRGVPDVSADGDPATAMANYVSGSWTQIGGTSAAAPAWAALGAIADQMAGHPLGFINPGLYKVAASSAYSQAFHDITSGNNSVDNGSVNVKGYSAMTGWDPITGLGSPNAAVLLPDLIADLKQ
jgi:subtilase family serine protease